MLEALLHAAQVAHAVVDDTQYELLTTTPWWTARRSRADGEQTTSKDAASMRWCALSPASERTWRVMPAFVAKATRNSLASVVSKVPIISIGSATS